MQLCLRAVKLTNSIALYSASRLGVIRYNRRTQRNRVNNVHSKCELLLPVERSRRRCLIKLGVGPVIAVGRNLAMSDQCGLHETNIQPYVCPCI